MANEAQKEPTMEEILASIRKIISEEDGGAPAPAAGTDAEELRLADIEINDTDDSAFDALTVDDFEEDFAANDDLMDIVEPDDDSMFDTASDMEEVDLSGLDSIEDTGAEPVALEAAEILPPVIDEPVLEDPVFETPSFDDVTEESLPDFAAMAGVDAEPAQETYETQYEEPDMAAAQSRYQDTVLTDDNTADIAAGALGKLISKMDVSGDNTIEGLVREMLKPMIKEWLDANLPGIVETKVEAEVQRIARMAR